ncbi:hypothetical protein BJ988_004380 [Nocardioides panzhihuensis]|uniref:Uncharacterized protein n=1 Tax=Nocardioides panzhihuensis TaxID=860243 RepID=A0A7Z0IUA5_9ACTN|nr:hypothetical protein [Nocardioides panzhihuensis]
MSKVLWHFSMSLDGFVDSTEPGTRAARRSGCTT